MDIVFEVVKFVVLFTIGYLFGRGLGSLLFNGDVRWWVVERERRERKGYARR